MDKVRQLREERGDTLGDATQSLAVAETVANIVASPSQPVRPSEMAVSQKPSLASFSLKAGREDGRQLIPSSSLELVITQAVRNGVPDCEAFVGVIVERTSPKSQLDANWALRGVKFGRTDREKVSQALAIIIKALQSDYDLSKD
jgi:hypothetical protein